MNDQPTPDEIRVTNAVIHLCTEWLVAHPEMSAAYEIRRGQDGSVAIVNKETEEVGVTFSASEVVATALRLEQLDKPNPN
jgi:hypothetical protein